MNGDVSVERQMVAKSWTPRERWLLALFVVAVGTAAYFAWQKQPSLQKTVQLEHNQRSAMPVPRAWNVPLYIQPDKCDYRVIAFDAKDSVSLGGSGTRGAVLQHRSEFESNDAICTIVVVNEGRVVAAAELTFGELSQLSSIHVKSPCNVLLGRRDSSQLDENTRLLFEFDPPITRFVSEAQNR